MFKKIIKFRKKIFFILKKKMHKNIYNNFYYFNFLKRLLLKNIKFFSIKCFKKKYQLKKFFNYFFTNYYFFFIKNSLLKKTIYIFSNKKIIIIIKNSFISFIFLNKIYLNLILFFSKCLILFKFNTIKKIFFLNFNNLFIKYIFLNNIFLNNKIFFLKKNNFFNYNNVIKNKNCYYHLIIEINHYSNNCCSIEQSISYNFFNVLKFISNVFVKKNINKIFVYQKIENFMKKKNIFFINLNIYLSSKKIYCKHKIIFLNFFNKTYNFLKNTFLNIF